VNTFISSNPFPAGFDLPAMQQWMMKAEEAGIQYMIMGQITEGAGLIIGALMIYHELTLSLPPCYMNLH
jgi:NADH:ubiquinone oxidoreductase subunit 2 (subunit N)